ncbi:MAG: cobyrinate a,c-diamide synthase [Pseudomonadota bacterium]
MSAPRALLLSAPSSGAGKTIATLAVLRAWRDQGRGVAGAKSGPDYIDPGFHAAAAGRPSVTLDAWASAPDALRARAREHAQAAQAELVLVEGAMGLLDAAAPNALGVGGSAADLAAALGAPAALVIDIAGQAQSAALAAAGARALRPDLTLAGVILNRAASDRHAARAEAALAAAGVRCFGALPRAAELATPARHLGLTPAAERADLEPFLARAGALAARHLDLDALAAAAAPLSPARRPAPPRLAPLGARIAVARDAAFAFAYPHMLSDWRAQGAEIAPFSPLADEAPDAAADAVFLPGGYPELHAGRLAAAARFLAGLREAAARGARVLGECGGYMALGEGLVDGAGARWPMAGLLPLETSFAERRLHLGARRLAPTQAAAAALAWRGPISGHEFHYAAYSAAPGPSRRIVA